MPATDIERLVVSMEARTVQFEKAMQRAVGVTNRRMKEIDDRTAKSHALLAKFGTGAFAGLTGGAVAALAPILSVAAAINGAKGALEAFSKVADNATASGLDAEFFQGLAYQAQQSGVEFDDLSKALQTFNRNSGLADAGTGRMVSALMKLNPALLESIRSATTQEERVRLAAQALADAGSASEKAALAVALFGDAGLKLVDAFRGGADSINSMQVKARQLGLIVDRDLISRAEELGDEFETMTQVVDIQLKKALLDLAPVLIGLGQLVGGIAATIGYISQGVRNTGDQATDHLERRLKLLQSGGQGITGKGGTAALAAAEQKRQAEMAEIMTELRRRAMDDLTRQLTAPKMPEVTFEDDGDLPGIGGGSAGSRNEAAEATIRQAEAVRALIADLQFEQEQLGLTAQQQELNNLLKQAGVTAESEYGLAIQAALGPLQAQRAMIEANAEAMSLFETAADNALDALIDGLVEGKDAGEALGNIIQDLGKDLFKLGLNTILGGVGGGNPLGFLFGGKGFATGTANTGGARGEPRGVVHGQEAVIPLPNGGRVPVDIRLPALAGQPAPATPSAVHISVDVTGARGNAEIQQMVADGVARGIKANNKQLPNLIADINMRQG